MTQRPDDDEVELISDGQSEASSAEESEDDAARTEEISFRVRRKLPGRRLDKYIHTRYSNFSRTKIQQLIKEGAIRVNGRKTKASYEMNGGDLVEMTVPAPEPSELVAEDIPLEIIYEDDHLLAINKDAGIICHPARQYQSGTIANAVMFHSQQLSSGTDPWRPGIVHRLDKNTTGVMLIAKHDEAHWRLSLQFEKRTVQKTYLAVVHGNIRLDSDVVDAPIGVHHVVREKFAVMVKENKIDLGKSAVTRYQVAERYGDFTLVQMFPKTGRTHQLRVHMSHLGYPIVGDDMYGGRKISEADITGSGDTDPIFEYQALHAWRISFKHPILETPLQIEAPFHDRFKRLVTLLRNRAGLRQSSD